MEMLPTKEKSSDILDSHQCLYRDTPTTSYTFKVPIVNVKADFLSSQKPFQRAGNSSQARKTISSHHMDVKMN